MIKTVLSVGIVHVRTETEFFNEKNLLIMQIQQTPNRSMGTWVVATKYCRVVTSYAVTAINYLKNLLLSDLLALFKY